MRLSELAFRVGGELRGDGQIEIRGVAGIRDAKKGDLTFLGHRRYEGFLSTTKASAVIMDDPARDVTSEHLGRNGDFAVIHNPNPYLAFQKAMTILYGDLYHPPVGVHERAVVAPDVKMGRNVSIGANVVVEAGTVIGDDVTIRPGTYVGADVVIGDGSHLYPNVTIRERVRIGRNNIIHAGAVIGDDGFGLASDGTENHKIPQIGCVVLEDDVEVGSNACIDRATIGETVIERGTRIDNLVQIAHNVTVGRHTVICAQVGVAGSAKIGNEVILAGQVGISGHVEVGDNAIVGAQAGVIGKIEPGQRVSGYPARPHAEQLRTTAASRRVPELLKRIDDLERRLAMLERQRAETE